MELTFFIHQLGGRNNIETLMLRKDFYNRLIKENLIEEGDKNADVWVFLANKNK